MSISNTIKKLTLIATNPSILCASSKYLFILSHMRSRSSVLSHVLGSNEGICGYSELQSSYLRRRDIINMRIKLHQELNCELKDKYLLDKILHNSLTISNEVYNLINPKVIYLLRKPESTIKSIINMGYITGISWYKDPEQATNYYCSRLSRLAEYTKIIKSDYFFIESDDLINDTDNILRNLTDWLGLDTPLTSEYAMFDNTGKPRHGDPSDNIRTGKIIETKSFPEIEIPLEILQTAESSYEKCKTALTAK